VEKRKQDRASALSYFRVSKNPPTVKKQNEAMVFPKAFSLRRRWQKSLIFDG
jgi:hypothetical protein